MMLLSNIYNIAIVFGLLWNRDSVIDKRMWSNLRKNTNGNISLGLAIGEWRRVLCYFYRRYKLLSYVCFCVIVIALKKFAENPCYNHVKKCTSVFTTNSLGQGFSVYVFNAMHRNTLKMTNFNIFCLREQ